MYSMYNLEGGIFQPSPQHIKFENVYDLIESDKIIEDLFFKLSGYRRQTIQGKTMFLRAKQPIFTDECILELISMFRIYSNPVTALGNWNKAEINDRVFGVMTEVTKFLATVGDDHFISATTWEKILYQHKHYKEVEENITVDNKTIKRKVLVSGWYEITHDNWNEHSPVSLLMLNTDITNREGLTVRVKDPLENANQFRFMSTIWEQVYIFLEASLRRSMDKLTLEYNAGMLKAGAGEIEQKKEPQGMVGIQ